jgi:hypothetical protein
MFPSSLPSTLRDSDDTETPAASRPRNRYDPPTSNTGAVARSMLVEIGAASTLIGTLKLWVSVRDVT